MSVVIKPGQIWRRKTDSTLVEVTKFDGFDYAATGISSDVTYRRVGSKGIGTSQCYAKNFIKRYDLVEEVA